MPNASVETRLSDNYTLNCDLVSSFWESFGGRRFKFGQLISEARYYFKNSFNGFYTGGYAAAHIFNMTKWNYAKRTRYQKGWGISLGVTLGYQYKLSEKWLLDAYIGGGWQHSEYRGYFHKTQEKYASLNGSGEWLPYKLGLSFAYKIGRR